MCWIPLTEFIEPNVSKHLGDALLANTRAETLCFQGKFEVLIDR
jgi:hypothetical protein